MQVRWYRGKLRILLDYVDNIHPNWGCTPYQARIGHAIYLRDGGCMDVGKLSRSCMNLVRVLLMGFRDYLSVGAIREIEGIRDRIKGGM